MLCMDPRAADVHSPLPRKHQPQLKLPADHLKVLHSFYMVKTTKLAIHCQIKKKKKILLEHQFKVYLPEEMSALFLFCWGQAELSVPSHGYCSIHHRYEISLSTETKKFSSIAILIIFNKQHMEITLLKAG